jgi:malate/lactate dehydrogenase
VGSIPTPGTKRNQLVTRISQCAFVGVPVKLGARGVEQIIEIKLTPEEDAALRKSAAAVKELTDVIKV